MGKFVIPLADYNRIHQVAHGVLKDIGTVEKACKFFSIFGAYILDQHYGIPARPVAGGFSLCIGPGNCLIYGRREDGEYVVDADGFHMWVQTETHVIDFTAPIYQEAFGADNPTVVLPRKMFQKRLSDEKQTMDSLTNVGDFITYPDPDLSNELIKRFMSKPQGSDLVQVGEHWFGNRRKKQAAESRMMNDLGEVTNLSLPKVAASGAW